MFQFNFELEPNETEDELATNLENPPSGSLASNASASISPYPNKTASSIFSEHSLIDLAEKLPPGISFSPLTIHLPSGRTVYISRRDLFDARLQVMATSVSEDMDSASTDGLTDLEFVEAPSDLVPGIYEGGLKTWECSIDLAARLSQLLGPDPGRSLRNKRIIELGCGTAVPSLYLLYEIFSCQATTSGSISIHLQDYNDLVFRLVTLPNMILTWYMSPASSAFRTKSSETDRDDDADPLPPVDTSVAGELPISPALVSSFMKSLKEYDIELRFFSGSWETFNLQQTGGKYDIVITSETIYRTDSLPSLLDLMWKACTGVEDSELDKLTQQQLAINSSEEYPGRKESESSLCVVAAKLVYFGVGGGVVEFERAVENGTPSDVRRSRGQVETIWRREEGVKRNVMQIHWK